MSFLQGWKHQIYVRGEKNEIMLLRVCIHQINYQKENPEQQPSPHPFSSTAHNALLSILNAAYTNTHKKTLAFPLSQNLKNPKTKKK